MIEQEHYNFTTKTTWGDKRKRRHLSLIVDNVISKLKPTGKLLEIGPGRGEFAEIITSKGYDYVGIEPSESLRNMLLKKNLKILSDPIPQLSIDCESVDIIYSYDVVEHLDNYANVLRFFNESYRALKPDGYIVVIAPNADTLGNIFYTHEYQHNYFTNISRLEGLLNDSKFKICRSKAFLTNAGLSENILINAFDRIFAQAILVFARSILLTSILNALFGRAFIFKVHKNIFDHVLVIARKQP